LGLAVSRVRETRREAGRLFRRCELASIKKVKAPDYAGALRRVHPPPKTMSISATAFRSSHGIGPGTSVVLIRWIRRAAFVGPAARSRPCGHAFFMLRFLAGGSAGTDGSVIGCAGCGLVLSGRNERRTEQRCDDKSRDCKFGSHQNGLPRLQDQAKPQAGDSVPACGKNIAQVSFSKTLGGRCANIRYFSNIRHLPNIGSTQTGSIVCESSMRDNVGQELYRGDTPCSWNGSVGLDAKNAEKPWHCGSSNLKDPVSIRGRSNARNALSPTPWWYRFPAT